MIQAVVNPAYRSGFLGMHYTSVPNIMKVIEPCFSMNFEKSLKKSKGKTNPQPRKLISGFPK
jgi:hypothetical protein